MLGDRRSVRGAIGTDTLLKIILVLVAVWLALEITGEFVDTVGELIGPFDNIIGLVILLIIVLFLLDRI